MKGIFALLVAVLLLMPLAFAQESTENEITDQNESELTENPTTGNDIADNETQNEVATMNTTLGAEVRLLQLEKNIERNIVRAQAVVAFIKESNSTVNTSELEAIIQQLQALDEQVKAINPQGPADETAQQFVALKNDAIELSKTFRDDARAIIKASDLTKLKNRMNTAEKQDTELQQENNTIVQAIRDYNAYRIQVMLQAMNLTDDNLVEQVKTGELNYGQANSDLMKKFAALTPTEKQTVRANFNGMVQKRKQFAEEAVTQAEQQYLEKRSERLTERLNRIEQNSQTNKTAAANLVNEMMSRANSKANSTRGVGANE